MKLDHSGKQLSPPQTLLSDLAFDFLHLNFFLLFYHYRNFSFHNSILIWEEAVFFQVLSKYRKLEHVQDLWGFSRWCSVFLLHFRFFLSENSTMIIFALSLMISIYCFKWIEIQAFLFLLSKNLNSLCMSLLPLYLIAL